MVSGHVIKLVDQKSGNRISEEVALKWPSQEKGPEEGETQPQETKEITIPSSSAPGGAVHRRAQNEDCTGKEFMYFFTSKTIDS